MRVNGRAICLLVSCVFVISCQTTKPEPAPETPAAGLFEPAHCVSQIHFAEGANRGLFSPDSYAVWVGPEVMALKREQQKAVDPDFDAAAQDIGENYLIFECHIASLFGDMSIAYDVVGFRGIDVYLLEPDGSEVRPMQIVIDTSATEEQREALRLFGRTNVLIFPQRNVFLNTPTISEDAAAVKLVLEGYNSKFYFEWPALSSGEPSKFYRSQSEAMQAVRMGFNDLVRRIQRLSQRFH